MNFVEYQQCVQYQKSKGKNVNKHMSINSRVVLEKKKRIITSEISFILVKCFFFASDNFQGTFVDSRFMMS